MSRQEMDTARVASLSHQGTTRVTKHWTCTRQGATLAIELFYHDRGFSVATDFSKWLTTHCVVHCLSHYSWTLFTLGFQILVSSLVGPKKKKKDPRGFGVSQLFFNNFLFG